MNDLIRLAKVLLMMLDYILSLNLPDHLGGGLIIESTTNRKPYPLVPTRPYHYRRPEPNAPN
jgi:hypothetical protein